jgi:hypothetical protein
MISQITQTGFSKVLKPESVRLYNGSPVLCVLTNGGVVQGTIVATEEKLKDGQKVRYLALMLAPLSDKEPIAHTSTRSNDPAVVGKSLLDSVSGG